LTAVVRSGLKSYRKVDMAIDGPKDAVIEFNGNP